jgi:nucleotidyltransferase/DNA polymerase involved in DNA repair
LKLDAIEGIGDATRKKLEKVGIQSVKDLASVDTQAVNVPGLPRDRLQALKKQAQRAIYAAATSRIVNAARATGRAVVESVGVIDQQVRAAAKEALEAAWEAEQRALEALRASQTRAVAVAEAAAVHARSAQRVASEKARFVVAQLQQAPDKVKVVWMEYAKSAANAEAKATAAAKRAADTANGMVRRKAASAMDQSRSLMTRMKTYISSDDKP